MKPAPAIVVFALLTTPLSQLHGQTASGLGDLIAVRGSSAESALGSRGYQSSGNKGAASMWWNSASKTCVSMYVDDGRVQSIQSASASDCGKGGGSGAGAAIAGIAAIGLIAALASHKKSSGDNHGSDQHDAEYQRGYNDGFNGGQYANNDSEGYHEGYMAGDAQRRNRWAANTSVVRSAPQVALDACSQRGDSFLGMPGGTSVPVSTNKLDSGNFQVTVAAGHYRALCTVTPSGYVTSMDPYSRQ